jgi:hypothetical protein
VAGPDQVASAVEFGVEPQQGQAVAGRIDLGQQGDEPVGGVRDQGAHLVVGVEGAVGFAHRCGPSGLDAPALVVGEVQVQHVELVQRGQVDQRPDLGRREEPAHHVDGEATPSEPRGVEDVQRRQ